MYCEECGAELRDGSISCDRCGSINGKREAVQGRDGATTGSDVGVSRSPAMILGASVSVCSIFIFISSFLPWIRVDFMGVKESLTGSGLMAPSGEFWEGFMDGFFMLRWGGGQGAGGGGMLFTGFWSLALAAAVVALAVLLFMNKGTGCKLAVITGAIGFVIALVDIIMIFAVVGSEYFPYAPGSGLWLLLLFSVALCAAGMVGLGYVE